MTDGMTTQRWVAEVPVEPVRISELTATQPGVLLHALFNDSPVPVSGDQLPHVVAFDGRFYLEDGHHRAVRVLLRGGDLMNARVLRIT